jgi:hypothetical protein
MPWPNQFWPNQAWPNQSLTAPPGPTRGFNCTSYRNLPTQAVPGDLWYTTDTNDLYMALQGPNQYFQGQTDNANVTRVWELGLKVVVTEQKNVPSVDDAGTIYLTTDTLKAYAGTGVSMVKFRLNVPRALMGSPAQSQAGVIGGDAVAATLIPLAT